LFLRSTIAHLIYFSVAVNELKENLDTIFSTSLVIKL